MSNSNKSWTASKANRRSVEAKKKTLKMTMAETRAKELRNTKAKMVRVKKV